jgi:hypothetical protein
MSGIDRRRDSGKGEVVSIDARDPSHPQRLAPSRPPTPATVEPQATPAASERRIGLTPITLLLVLVVGYLLIQIQFVLVLVLLSLVFATVIQTPVDALERRHFPRPLAILLVYIGIIGAFTVLFVLLSPAIREQAVAFREQAPQSLAELRSAWLSSGNRAPRRSRAAIAVPRHRLHRQPVSGAGSQCAPGRRIGTADWARWWHHRPPDGPRYLLLLPDERSWIRRIILLDSPPETRIRVSRIWDEVEQKVGDWLRGQLTLCLVIGVTATIGYAVMGIQFWPLLDCGLASPKSSRSWDPGSEVSQRFSLL